MAASKSLRHAHLRWIRSGPPHAPQPGRTAPGAASMRCHRTRLISIAVAASERFSSWPVATGEAEHPRPPAGSRRPTRAGVTGFAAASVGRGACMAAGRPDLGRGRKGEQLIGASCFETQCRCSSNLAGARARQLGQHPASLPMRWLARRFAEWPHPWSSPSWLMRGISNRPAMRSGRPDRKSPAFSGVRRRSCASRHLGIELAQIHLALSKSNQGSGSPSRLKRSAPTAPCGWRRH